MPRSPRILFEGAIYHVTFRGNNRQEIFADVRDRRRFLDVLEEFGDKHRVRIYLFCLMPNHVHLLIETPLGNLNRFMASLLTSYTLYFNIKNNRSGHLFQGRYHAQVVSGDQYLLRLSRYIHLNPVRTSYWDEKPLAEKKEFLDQFAWSSYRAYAGLAPSPDWLERAPLLALVAPKSSAPELEYRLFIQAGMAESDQEMQDFVRAHQRIIGSDTFIKSIYARPGTKLDARATQLRKTSVWIPPEKIKSTLLDYWKITDEELKQRRAFGYYRAVLSIAWQKFSGLNQKSVAQLLDIKSSSSVSIKMKKWKSDPRTNESLDALAKQLNIEN